MSKTQALRPQSQCTVRHASAWLLCPEATLNATHLFPPPILGTPSVNVDMIAAGMSERHLQLTTEGDTNQAVCPRRNRPSGSRKDVLTDGKLPIIEPASINCPCKGGISAPPTIAITRPADARLASLRGYAQRRLPFPDEEWDASQLAFATYLGSSF